MGWTRREMREQEWSKEVLNVLDPYKDIEKDELRYV